MVGVARLTKEEAKARALARQKAWREANKEHRKAYKAEWASANAEHVKTYSQAVSKEYRSKSEVQLATWMRNLHRNYKMTPQDFNALWTKQEGRCEICKVDMAPRGKQKNSVCVDHNHSTGEVRGLLCRDCNRGLGVFRDLPGLLDSAAKYLREKGHYGHDLT